MSYSFAVELLGRLLVVWLVEGIDLSLRWDFLAIGEIVSGGQLAALELNG